MVPPQKAIQAEWYIAIKISRRNRSMEKKPSRFCAKGSGKVFQPTWKWCATEFGEEQHKSLLYLFWSFNFCPLFDEYNGNLSLVNAGGRRQYLLCALCGARLQPQRWSKCDNEEVPQVLVFVLLAHCNHNARKGIFEAFRSISKLLVRPKSFFCSANSGGWRAWSFPETTKPAARSDIPEIWDSKRSKVFLFLQSLQFLQFERPQLPHVPQPLPASPATLSPTLSTRKASRENFSQWQ